MNEASLIHIPAPTAPQAGAAGSQARQGPRQGRGEVFDRIAVETHALFLDVDGTLIDLAPRPDAVHVPAGLRETLAALHVLTDGAVALVSGRTVATLDDLFAPLRLPAAGGHGAQLRADPVADALCTPDLDPEIAALLRTVPERFAGAFAEDKGSSIAIHFRACPEQGAKIGAALAEALGRAGEAASGLDILPGHFVLEVRRAGSDKGSAVNALMAAPPFRGRIPVVIGDDVTDEAAFAAAQVRGGLAISVGRAADGVDAVLADPANVRAHLAQLVVRGRPGSALSPAGVSSAPPPKASIENA